MPGQDIDKEFKNAIRIHEKPVILIATPEITELPEGIGNAANIITAKGGGLGDISASLVRYFSDADKYDIHVVLPKYDNRIKQLSDITNKQIDRLTLVLRGKGIHLVNDSAFAHLSNPYEDNKIHSRVRRSLAYQRNVINDLIDWLRPDVIHCNDWMTALIPSAARAKGVKTLFTLHNIFTELQTLKAIELSGLKPFEFGEFLYFEKFPENLLENWEQHFHTNRVDFTASAIMAADYFNTVSPTFLVELIEGKFSHLVPESIYLTIKNKFENGRAAGILNSPNVHVNPRYMNHIHNYSKKTVLTGKAINKENFQRKLGLPLEKDVPLFFWPNRLFYQKAPELLLDNIEYFFNRYDMQVAIIANGDAELEHQAIRLAKQYERFAYRTFDEDVSNLGKAAADFILMPSRYEPCGLPQMEAPKFGTLPVVHATGGLKDTINQLDVCKNKGNGFLFYLNDRIGLEYGIVEALEFYKLPPEIKEVQIQRIMMEAERDFDMENTARKYMEIYDLLLEESEKEIARRET
ncbi:MAG: glycogen/starch synthase [Candidatus Cloacimonetes bacterium]|nr:glycogen/starch synthase [Candidatus Cloacimonadota bacterium]